MFFGIIFLFAVFLVIAIAANSSTSDPSRRGYRSCGSSWDPNYENYYDKYGNCQRRYVHRRRRYSYGGAEDENKGIEARGGEERGEFFSLALGGRGGRRRRIIEV